MQHYPQKLTSLNKHVKWNKVYRRRISLLGNTPPSQGGGSRFDSYSCQRVI